MGCYKKAKGRFEILAIEESSSPEKWHLRSAAILKWTSTCLLWKRVPVLFSYTAKVR